MLCVFFFFVLFVLFSSVTRLPFSVILQHCGEKSSRCRSEMNILAAWQRGYTGKNVVVTILDDGIERNHPDLAQNYVSLLNPHACQWKAKPSSSY